MKEIVFATSNPNKIREVKELLKDRVSLLGLKDINCTEEIPETTNTIEGNALQKARYVYEHYNVNCFSEDSGLEIDALNGAPGVHTAYYAGPERDPDANMALVLEQLYNIVERGAQFKTVIALILDNQEYTFTGIARGKIALERTGNKGFGYDPIFIPNGYTHTFAEIDAKTKNSISHRGKAVRQLIEFLNNRQL